jgi:hypothetical protein
MSAEQTTQTPEQVEILVNDKLVVLRQQSATGRHIKETAIQQDVHIHLDDQLWEEMEDGAVKAVPDDQEVSLRHHHHFTATPPESHPKVYTISVNEMPVKIEGHLATGAQIKTAAIAQGVLIKQNFVLQEELPNGTSRIVGDVDSVHLRDHLRFTAIAPDDNS